MSFPKVTSEGYEAYYKAIYYADRIEDYQILQRNRKSDSATVIFHNGTQQIYKSGGPYTIKEANNVYVGDIWVMAGQSNMRGHGYQVDPYSNCSLIEHGQPGIHLYNSEEEWTLAEEPLHQLYKSKRTVHHTLPDPTVKNPKLLEYRGASLGLSFAKLYQKNESNIAVGLVASAHGGTSLNDWKRPDTLNKDTEDTTLYGAMMARIKAVGGRIAGILWYQGESDTNTAQDASTYEPRFRRWLDQVREDVGYQALPIAFVQIGPHAIDSEETKKNWTTVQLAQYRILLEQAHTAGVSSIGCSLDDRLHLSAKGLQVVGERLAIVASKLVGSLGTPAFVPKDTFSAQYQEPVLPHLKGSLPPCIVFTDQGWAARHTNTDDDLTLDIAGFGLECADKKVAIINARVEKNRNQVKIWISHEPDGDLFLTYGLKYPLIDSYNKGWPAFLIRVKPCRDN